MSIKNSRIGRSGCLILATIFAMLVFILAEQTAAKEASNPETATAESTDKTQAPPATSMDEYHRGTPRTSLEGFFDVTRDGDFETAAKYLDLSSMPQDLRPTRGPELASQLKVVLERSLDIDLDGVSADPKGDTEDGLNASQEVLGRLKTPQRTVSIRLQRMPRGDGVLIWKFSKQTVANIPLLYTHFGYRPLEERLSRFFPNVVILGWQLWQYAAFFIGIGLAYLAAYAFSILIRWLVTRSDREVGRQMATLGIGPVRILLWFFLADRVLVYLGPSVTIRAILSQDLLGIIAVTWAASRMVELGHAVWVKRLQERGQESAIPLLKPAKTFAKIVLILLAALVWLDNLGFDVGTLLAGLGVGGVAFALAAQDTLKNLIGSVMVLLDKPYRVGQRIVVKGHDGVVEEVGLRSTRLRLLTGHQTTIPNEQMASTDIENIDRRPNIRRLFNIAIRYDTPLEKVDQAVSIIQGILDNHEGMDPELTPRVYFNKFNRDSLNIIALFWYHPPDYWAFMDLCQRINRQIMHEFEQAGIQFALPSQTVYAESTVASRAAIVGEA
jgi:MscS family membrane protein